MYVKRDQYGRVIAISLEKSAEFTESISIDSIDVQHFFQEEKQGDHAFTDSLHESDVDFIRVLEDLINLLSSKGIIQFTELPAEVQKKLLTRQSIRSNTNKLHLFDEDALTNVTAD